MSKKEFISDTSVSDNYGKGFKVLKKNFWPLVGITLLVTLIDSFFRFISKELGNVNQAASVVLGLAIGFLVMAPIQVGSTWLMLKAARDKKFQASDIFSAFKKNYQAAVIAPILSFILGVVGLILLIIPGIIVMIRLAFVNYLIMDNGLSAIDAIKTSWELTKGHSWKILGMGLLAIPIIIGGLVCLLVGIIPATAWIGTSSAVLYNSIKK